MSYQKVVGTLTNGAHPGACNGQDVYSDLLITEKGQNVDKLGWSASCSNINNEKCGGAQRMPDKDNFNAVTNDVTYIVRRLTPTECARLQGFPDWWTADVPHADSAEYKMWGNGVSLPCVLYVMEGIAKTLREEEGEQNRIPDNNRNEGDNTA